MKHEYSEVMKQLADSANAIVRYKTQILLQGFRADNPQVRYRREDIQDSSIAQNLLADLAMSHADSRNGMRTIYLMPKYLADIDYPPGDISLHPYRDQVHHNKTKDGYTNVYWEREKLGMANQFLTVDALEILKKAGRFG